MRRIRTRIIEFVGFKRPVVSIDSRTIQFGSNSSSHWHCHFGNLAESVFLGPELLAEISKLAYIPYILANIKKDILRKVSRPISAFEFSFISV